MTIADIFSLIGQIPVENVFWLAGAFLFVGLVLGAFSVFAK